MRLPGEGRRGTRERARFHDTDINRLVRSTMKIGKAEPRQVGITWRIALLSWFVTIVTLTIFVMVVIPEQRQIYLQNLESKARGIAVSLKDVASGAVVTEDYSTVVDHCLQILKGDPGTSFIVMTRNDGFSLLIEPSNWRSETLDSTWRPAVRKPASGIQSVPIFGRRVYRYVEPFDTSGLEWGWIHIGLSLNAYDQSIAAVYTRTSVLAVVCVCLSLVGSIAYARRLVRPIRSLQEVVRTVARGDLSARADIRSGDEVEGLANSFNSMTDKLLRRDRILESVRFAAQELLTSDDWRDVIDQVLAMAGRAADVHRAYVVENQTGEDGRILCCETFHWASTGIGLQARASSQGGVYWQGAGFERFAGLLRRGQIVRTHWNELSAAEQAVLDPSARSLLLIPIMVRETWWGFLGFDDCRPEREWGEAERDSFQTAAEMLGAAIERKQTQDALLEAKETLEQRVRERTRELQEQMEARLGALAQLAEAQNSLMEMSRKSGMAEVATGVLHNVGNVLNSINVSTTLVIERLQQSRVTNLSKAADLLAGHGGRLGEFFDSDPKGRHLPGYLISLARHLADEQSSLVGEMTSLREKVDHVKEIVSMQQSYARVSGVIETVSLVSLVEDALKLNEGALARHEVRVVRDYREDPLVAVDKHKVLQILLNVIRNAKYALDESTRADKVLTVRIHSASDQWVQLDVIDNGIGIAGENLTRIFSHGFTTRLDGHGFGLHSGAIAARELGGSLEAFSEGLGCGATLTLKLPLDRESMKC